MTDDTRSLAIAEKVAEAAAKGTGAIQLNDKTALALTAHLREQAEEIERLKAANLRWQETADRMNAECEQHRQEVASLQAELEQLRMRTVVAENRSLLERMGRSSYQEAVEDKLRIELAETQVRAEQAERALEHERTKALDEAIRVVGKIKIPALGNGDAVRGWANGSAACLEALRRLRENGSSHAFRRESGMTEAARQALLDAMGSLRREVHGMLTAFGPEPRGVIGNTNVAVLELRVREAYAAEAEALASGVSSETPAKRCIDCQKPLVGDDARYDICEVCEVSFHAAESEPITNLREHGGGSD